MTTNKQSNSDLRERLKEILFEFTGKLSCDYPPQHNGALDQATQSLLNIFETELSKAVVGARVDELKRIMKGEKTITQYVGTDVKDIITYVFSADEIQDRIKTLTSKERNDE
jgi:hypothetical protein